MRPCNSNEWLTGRCSPNAFCSNNAAKYLKTFCGSATRSHVERFAKYVVLLFLLLLLLMHIACVFAHMANVVVCLCVYWDSICIMLCGYANSQNISQVSGRVDPLFCCVFGGQIQFSDFSSL